MSNTAGSPGVRASVGVIVAVTIAVIGGACESASPRLPTAEQVAATYVYEGELTAAMVGNVAEITVTQPSGQLRGGGTLWAKVGPYIFLFSDETRALFEGYGGLAAVRVITKDVRDREVARAMLLRDTLNDITWRRAITVSARARRDGSRSPALIEDLVRWGQDHTEYEYSTRYVRE